MTHFLFLEPEVMQWMEGLTIFLIGFVVFSLIVFFVGLFFSVISYYFSSLELEALLLKDNYKLKKHFLTSEEEKWLNENFIYFRQIPNQELKDLFAKKVARFIALKKFMPRGGLDLVTTEMKLLIAAYAIQVTFGWPHVYLVHFKNIAVYPDVYFSEINMNYHKGEVNMKGAIVFAWKILKEELQTPHNGRNLGIHEMSHALYLENMIKNEEYGFIRNQYIDELKIAFYEECEKEQTFLREYGFQNIVEFFAVVSEVFFEKGIELREQKPELYQLFAKIYNQDPLLHLYPLQPYSGTSLGDYLEEIFRFKKWKKVVLGAK